MSVGIPRDPRSHAPASGASPAKPGGRLEAELAELVRLERLRPLLAQVIGDPAWLALNATLIPGGKSNLTFELSCPAGQLILRRPPSGRLLPSAHDMAREARIQQALAGTSVPVARVVTVEESAQLIGAPFYVMAKVRGHVIRDELPAGYAEAEDERRRMADALVDTLAELHAIDPEPVGLGDFGRPAGFLARQLGRWRSQWEGSRPDDVPALDALGRELELRLPKRSEAAVVHGDFRLDNCLTDPDDPGTIAAVLDWELSTLGDPLTDLGLLLFYWRQAGERQHVLAPTVTALPGFPGRRHLVERYAGRTGRNVEEIRFYEAFAHFKFAVIAQGVAARVAAGAMAGQDFGDLRDEIVRVAEDGRATLAGTA